MPPLPIEQVLPELRAALRARPSAVLQAPPGAGKTTRVPLALLDEPWLAGRKTLLLEPRRLAARAAARRMADTLGERVGETVGHRVRMDTRVGPATRVEVVTEGVLTRLVLDDPALEDVGLVIFDEFHERNLVSDLGLALCLQSRELLRDDLRILVMSATLDGAPVAALLGDPAAGPAPLVTSEGRSFPVETRYADRRPDGRVEPAVAATVRAALARDAGDVLVFLPGAAEIRRAASLLGDAGPGVRVAPLYGNLPQREQDAALAPAAAGERKVVLATSIAETSLTIDGVRVVVDAGLSRVPRFSPRSGMTRLETVRVSRAAADQRRGRAGRQAPGVAYRLWPEHEQHHLVPHDAPEILETDLAPLALDLAAAGVSDPAELRWLDPPPAAAFAHARELLAQLGALGPDGRITPRGRRMSDFGLHPRLSHMLLEGESSGMGALACDLAALLGERDVLRPAAPGAPPPDADLRLRLELLRAGGAAPAHLHGALVDRDALQRVRAQAAQWRRELGAPASRGAAAADDVEACGILLAYAYPDRVAQRRPGQGARFLLRNGLGAALAEGQALAAAPYLVAAELDGRRPESRIYLAAPVALDDLEAHLGDQIERERVVAWDADARGVMARERERLGAIVLRDAPLRNPDPALVAAAILDGVAREGLGVLPWSDAARRLQQRILFARQVDPRWPDVSDAALAATTAEWLAPHLDGVRRRDDLARLDLAAILLELVGWERRAALDELAPTHVVVPSGSRLPIDYADPAAPVLAVRLQEMFGLADTPRVGRGAVPLTLHLLSPAHRPVQVTRDLAGFWRGSYFEVRKELRGRYPKHHWPDDPLQATPTRRTRPRAG
ncbi:MAG: ATP-dependent helicase HrpB [Gemmatimonadaceae bacterium]